MKWVNQFHYGYDELPFGGVKQSVTARSTAQRASTTTSRTPRSSSEGSSSHGGQLEGSGAVGYITLDKPPANSYDFEFMEEMGAAVDAAAADDAVKVVIVRSASKKFFCAGADIKAFLANDTAGNMKMINRGHEALAAIAPRARRSSSPRSRATRSAAVWRSAWPATCASARAGATSSASRR